MWSISHPWEDFVLPYSDRAIVVPHASCLYESGLRPGITVPLSQTASIFSLEAMAEPHESHL